METHFLLDSNIVIYIRQKHPEAVVRRFARLRPGEAAISVIAFGELIYGAIKSSQRESGLARLRELSDALAVLPLPEKAAETYGLIRADLASRGELIGNNDLWIAALCRQHSLPLLSRDRHFDLVGGIRRAGW